MESLRLRNNRLSIVIIKIAIYMMLILMLSSCAKSSLLASRKYYNSHSEDILDLINAYVAINTIQTVDMGYLDSKYKEFTLQIYDDSTRYVYHSKNKQDYILDQISEQKIKAADIKVIVQKMKQSECLWINNLDFYIDGKRRPAVMLSFKAKFIQKPFSPAKFYRLLYVEETFPLEKTKKELRKSGIYEVAPKYYHAITSKFRP